MEDDSFRLKLFDFPNDIQFDRTIYSQLAEKIGLLDPNSRDKVIQYYAITNLVQERYNKFEILHGSNISILKSAKEGREWIDPLKKKVYIGDERSSQIELTEIERLLKYVEEVYDIGEKLIEYFKEQIK